MIIYIALIGFLITHKGVGPHQLTKKPKIRLLHYPRLLLASYRRQKLKMLEKDLFVKTLVFY